MAGAASGPSLPGRQRRRLPWGTTTAAIAARAARANAPPVTENATVCVNESTARGCGTATGPGDRAPVFGRGGSISVTASTGLIIPAPVCGPVPPSAVAMIRSTTCLAVSFG